MELEIVAVLVLPAEAKADKLRGLLLFCKRPVVVSGRLKGAGQTTSVVNKHCGSSLSGLSCFVGGTRHRVITCVSLRLLA